MPFPTEHETCVSKQIYAARVHGKAARTEPALMRADTH